MKRGPYQSSNDEMTMEEHARAMKKFIRSMPPPRKREFVLEEPKKNERPPDPIDFESLRKNPLDEKKDGAHIPPSSQWDVDL